MHRAMCLSLPDFIQKSENSRRKNNVLQNNTIFIIILMFYYPICTSFVWFDVI